MNLENYILTILKKDLKGYDSYIAGESILRYILGKPIEEYLVITSAPLFSFPKNQPHNSNQVEITKYPKKIILLLNTTKEEYLSKCNLSYETLLYHIDLGIIDSHSAIFDIQNQLFRLIHQGIDVYQVERILYLKYYLGFQFDENLQKEILNFSNSKRIIDTKKFYQFFLKILLLDLAGDLLLEYKLFFESYLPINLSNLFMMRYLKPNETLRLIALLWNMSPNDLSQFFYDYGINYKSYDLVYNILILKNTDLTNEGINELLQHLGKNIRVWFIVKRAEALAFGHMKKCRVYDDIEKSLNLDKLR